MTGAPDGGQDALLLDEMFSPRIAEELALRGVDCRARLAREAAGGPVPGLVCTSDVTFPRTKAYLSRLVTVLAAAAADRETAACGGVLWLRPPP